ncbi:STAS domain-containing protein [Streptomyces cyanogenus]|uniref:Anti-sigma factor antagonist n=1 Tax=Streptomyces cyanogenus TaxID=80860 RepID=A0ABX7TJ22_STRCY|nr:STAS domain-containing protein [Streptomyces cyanogenus]QTD96532.1 Anti-sigma-B factor antagonist [Streptomyces cyanogenus]
MALFLASHWENGWAVMEIKGALDTGTGRELCDFVAAVTAKHRHLLNLIVDLTELTWADAGGLGALLSVRALLDDDQGELRLVCPEGRVERLLHTSGLAEALAVHPSLDAALAAPRTSLTDRTGGAVQ